MDVKTVIYMLLIKRGRDINWLAGELGMKPQSLRTKLYRGTYSHEDVVRMFELLGAGFVVMTKEGDLFR